MSKIASISMCLIVKNEPMLEECILSFRDYVQEIIIIDTGSTDQATIAVAKKYADIFESYSGCNDPVTGLIEDFSNARNYSFSKATQPWIIWCDADDILTGGEHLADIIASAPPDTETTATSFMFKYEYAYNEAGQCICEHYRERLFSNKNKFKFVNPVHEVCVPNNGINCNFVTRDEVVYKHKRQFGNKIQESGRNLRILRAFFEKTKSTDPRQMYYLGLETYNAGLLDEAADLLKKYTDVSGWPDEIFMACLKLVDIYTAKGQYKEGLVWGFKAIETCENWGEGYFALAKMFYFLAQTGGPNEYKNWQKCVHFSKIGLDLPVTKTLLFVNPLDREYEIHLYLNMALSKLGDVEGALKSTVAGLQKKPTDGHLTTNKKIYETHIANCEAVTAINKLKELGKFSESNYNSIIALMANQPAPVVTPQPAVESESTVSSTGFPIAAISSDPNGWAIPNTLDFDGFPLQMTDEQLQATVIMIWKQYMLHDEVLSSQIFLENAPYNVRHSIITEKALEITKASFDWVGDKDNFQKINAPANAEVEAGNPLPNPLVWQEGNRFNLIKDHLAPNSTLIDFGSMDGCFTNRYGMLGHKPTGLDACDSTVKLANKKAIEFNTGATHICTYFQDAVGKVPDNSFEYATSSDTYEHLKDPVNDMLIPARQMLKVDGKFLLVTPHGAWMRGNYLEWAHPWLHAKEGKSWLKAHQRPHLVAPTVWSVSDHFKKAGYWVKDSYVSLCSPHSDVEGQGNVFAEAHKEIPKCSGQPLDIVFFIGDGVEVWTPKSVSKTGIGGSELMAIEQSKRLAGLGHRVRVYSGCGKYGEGIYDGVEYRTTDKYQDLECDVLIVSRRADMLGDHYNISAKIKLLWVHDVTPIAYTNELLLRADKILCLSEWHKQNVMKQCNVHESQIIVTRNGIDLTRFENKNIIRNKFKCVNASSPDRALPVLLSIWPQIKEQVPKAELHIYYGFRNWRYAAQWDQGQADLIVFLENKMKEMEPQGVVYHDRISQEELANEFLSAGVMLHPTFFTETYGISFANAQAAGLKIISSTIGALNEIVADRGVLLSGEWTDQSYQDKFVKEAVKAMLDD